MHLHGSTCFYWFNQRCQWCYASPHVSKSQPSMLGLLGWHPAVAGQMDQIGEHRGAPFHEHVAMALLLQEMPLNWISSTCSCRSMSSNWRSSSGSGRPTKKAWHFLLRSSTSFMRSSWGRNHVRIVQQAKPSTCSGQYTWRALGQAPRWVDGTTCGDHYPRSLTISLIRGSDGWCLQPR